MKARLIVILLSVTVGFSLAACSDDGDDDEGAAATSSSTSASGATSKGNAVMGPDGLGVAKFGDAADAALARFTEEFGAPERDFAPPECPQITRSLEWDALHVDLGQTFVGYSYATTGGPPIRTAKGIGQGSTVAQLKSAYGSDLAIEEGIESSQFTISFPDGKIVGYVTGTGDKDLVEGLYAGTVCGE